jgi:hypothetical protein
VKKIIAGGASAIALIATATALTACTGTAKTVTVTTPGPTVTQTVPGPTVTKTVPAPVPTEGTLLHFTGSGQESTGSFTVGGSGDYTVSWTYSNNDSTGDGGDNFIVNENTAGSGQDDNALSLPNDIQASGHGNTQIDGDTGSHSFSVQADQSAVWTLTVKSAP